jgi:hypothetical protein
MKLPPHIEALLIKAPTEKERWLNEGVEACYRAMTQLRPMEELRTGKLVAARDTNGNYVVVSWSENWEGWIDNASVFPEAMFVGGIPLPEVSQ